MCTLTGGAFPAAGVGRGVCAATPSSGPTRTGSNGHLPCPHFPQLLLPENMLNTKLQVCGRADARLHGMSRLFNEDTQLFGYYSNLEWLFL